ncbi:hypothetical protein FB639_004165 [Coemansia asiatica]|nr:hypothetical protein FB639_004165 [Coemansia asiatica]
MMPPQPASPHPFTTGLPQHLSIFSNKEAQQAPKSPNSSNNKRRRTIKDALEPVDPGMVQRGGGKKRKDSGMDIVATKKPRKDQSEPVVDVESSEDEEDGFPRLRVLDLPLSIRAQAFLQNDRKDIRSGQSNRDAQQCNALVLYKPPPPTVGVKNSRDEQREKQKQDKLIAASPSMDID